MASRDWKAYHDMALALARQGYIPIYADFCKELEEILLDCIFQIQRQGIKEITLLINSHGGDVTSFVAIKSAMALSNIEFTGLVMSRAYSSGFNILQACKVRKAVPGSTLMFHLGKFVLDNSMLCALDVEEQWPTQHVLSMVRDIMVAVQKRTGISMSDLRSFALHERTFSTLEALELNLIDEIVEFPLVEVNVPTD